MFLARTNLMFLARKTMSKKRGNKLRQVRPCNCCARKGRHYLDTQNPVLCEACSKMPSDWRHELGKSFKNRIETLKYYRKYEKKKLTNKQIRFSIEPISLPNYVDGGYPMVYYISGDAICGDCIHKTLQSCYLGPREEVLRGVHWEGLPEICTECNKEIESAYGEGENHVV